MRLDDTALEQLLQDGESFQVEFKERMTKKVSRDIREAVCAFANDLPDSRKPGVLFLGVDDRGEPVGLDITDELLRQLADVKNDGRIVPPPSMFVEKRTLTDHEVAVITVMPSDSPPVRYQGNIFVRSGPMRGIATAQDERLLNEKRRAGSPHFDTFPVPTADISALDRTLFENEYLPRAFSAQTLQANDRNLNERLAVTKMVVSVDEPTPTVVGLLTLGKSPLDFIPNAWVQFLRIDGERLADDIIDAATISGDLSTVIRRIDEKMMAHSDTRVDLKSSIIESRYYSYPLVALQQILRNAIMHRSYENTNAPVRITWFNDRVEIQSPGGPYGSVTKEKFGYPGVVDYRNPNLAEAMKVLGFVQRFGVGIDIARKALQDNGSPEIKFEVSDTHVLAIIERRPI